MRTIEVFKTNVGNKQAAKTILKEISLHQPKYQCNFDLEDCDKVLRIESASGKVNAELIFNILKKNNYKGDILQ